LKASRSITLDTAATLRNQRPQRLLPRNLLLLLLPLQRRKPHQRLQKQPYRLQRNLPAQVRNRTVNFSNVQPTRA
jgi:hypothetical protein